MKRHPHRTKVGEEIDLRERVRLLIEQSQQLIAESKRIAEESKTLVIRVKKASKL
jgi:hypothetical protein